ncbi:4414_t:CDS:2 [Cetraspora pellucida]|uniref:4414_t:CDS:1 n=1 Tax=Cetraspora pellucida TaxID=1433469 RepID=A0A9N8ZVR8_9GLOM|nr:4414_t:CDS:2 [Cetraspora pellucida]
MQINNESEWVDVESNNDKRNELDGGIQSSKKALIQYPEQLEACLKDIKTFDFSQFIINIEAIGHGASSVRACLDEILIELEKLSSETAEVEYITNQVKQLVSPLTRFNEQDDTKISENRTQTFNDLIKLKLSDEARAKWINYQFGGAHSLFHAIRLGSNFINIPVVKSMIANNAIITRYFIQKLSLQFEKNGQNFIEPKLDHDVNLNSSQDSRMSWANNLQDHIFYYLLNIAESQIIPNVDKIVGRLNELINIGFSLDYKVIGDILKLYEKKLCYIGNTLIEAFYLVKKGSKNELPKREFLNKCLIEALDSNRGFKELEPFNLLYLHIDNNHEQMFSDAMNFHLKKKRDNITWRTNNDIFKPLEFSSVFYNWCLHNFQDTYITDWCFEDILKTRISIDRYYQKNHIGYDPNTFNDVCDIFKTYCNTNNFYKPSHLKLISQATHADIFGTLFDYYLLTLFDIPTANASRKINIYRGDSCKNIIDWYKPLVTELHVDSYDISERENKKSEWINELEKIQYELLYDPNHLAATSKFWQYVNEFWEKFNKAKDIIKDANGHANIRDKSYDSRDSNA